MNEQQLGELFGIKAGYKVVKTEDTGAEVRLHLDVEESLLVCSKCASKNIIRKGSRHRNLKTVPIGLTPVVLHTEVVKCECLDCHKRFEISPPLPRPIAGSPIEWYCSHKP